MEANLLVTYDPAHPGKSKEEVKHLLEKAEEDGDFLDSDIEGVFLLKISGNPKSLVKKLHAFAGETESTFKWVPVEKWVRSEVNDMAKAISAINDRIDDNSTWKMDLAKRHYDKQSTTELIMKLTENIHKPKVELKNPEKIVKVEIIGDKAGISLLDRDELLDARKSR